MPLIDPADRRLRKRQCHGALPDDPDGKDSSHAVIMPR